MSSIEIPISDDVVKRFWTKVNKSDGCWEWTAATWGKGYGALGIDKHSYSAHRISYQMARGPIPDGLWVLHTCDNPKCVRPDHLWLGTNQDNMTDCLRKGRTTRGKPRGHNPRIAGDEHWSRKHPERIPRGENRNTTLIAEDVRTIRARYEGGGVYMRELAMEYGITLSSVSSIIRRVTWGHVA